MTREKRNAPDEHHEPRNLRAEVWLARAWSYGLAASIGWGLLWLLFQFPHSSWNASFWAWFGDAHPLVAFGILASFSLVVIFLALSPLTLFRPIARLLTPTPSTPPTRLRLKIGGMLSAIAAGALLTALMLPAQTLVLDSSCEPEGMFHSLKARWQGERFWAGQLRYLDSRLVSFATEPQRAARFREDMQRLMAETRRMVDELHNELHPDQRPSPAEQAAAPLRRQADELEEEADALEQAASDALWEEERQERIRSLQACRSLVEPRTGLVKFGPEGC